MSSSPRETHGQGQDLFVIGLVQHILVSDMMWAHILGLPVPKERSRTALAGGKGVWAALCRKPGQLAPSLLCPIPHQSVDYRGQGSICCKVRIIA